MRSESREIETDSRKSLRPRAGPLAHSRFRQNAAGDTVITTGDGKGVMIRYTFTA